MEVLIRIFWKRQKFWNKRRRLEENSQESLTFYILLLYWLYHRRSNTCDKNWDMNFYFQIFQFTCFVIDKIVFTVRGAHCVLFGQTKAHLIPYFITIAGSPCLPKKGIMRTPDSENNFLNFKICKLKFLKIKVHVPVFVARIWPPMGKTITDMVMLIWTMDCENGKRIIKN